MRIRSLRVLLGLSAIVSLSACGSGGGSAETSTGATSTGATSTTTSAVSTTPAPTIAAPPMTLGPETHKWVDLEVGDCIADVPAVDLGAVTVAIVDCAAAHAAEVYLRTPVEVNAAVADVANRACEAGVPEYTGRPVDGSPYSVTYLIDSGQDRTANNPLPSTVICLLQSASGQPLTESAHR
jgi:hypothetical protein